MPQINKIAIIGASGAVGKKLISLFDDYSSLSGENFLFFSSERMIGRTIVFKNETFFFDYLKDQEEYDFDLAFLCTDNEISRKYALKFLEKKIYVIDSSSEFRMEQKVPLILPEINGDELKASSSYLITNPNCVVSILLTGLLPVLENYQIKRMILSTYQSVSGSGNAAIDELLSQSKSYIHGLPYHPQIFQYPIAFNLFSHNSEICESGLNQEEEKIINETRKILNQKTLPINVTCIRVPIFYCHSISVYLELDKKVDLDLIFKNISHYPSIKLEDSSEFNLYPMPCNVTSKHQVYIGRLRTDKSNPYAMNLFIVGDQLLKGAALNLFQIAKSKFGLGIEDQFNVNILKRGL